MKGKTWLFGIGLLILATSLAFSAWCDESLDSGVDIWLEQMEQSLQADSQVYWLLLGLDAPVNMDPIILGRQRFEAYERGEKLSPAQVLTLASDNAQCELWRPGCLERMPRGGWSRGPLLASDRTLLKRYEHLLSLDDYRSKGWPGLDEPQGDYRLVIEANRLMAFQAVELARAGQGEQALLRIEEDLAGVRRQLASADQLIGKMVWLNLAGRDLDLLARLYSHDLIPLPAAQPELTVGERDLCPAFQREFAGIHHVLSDLDGQTESLTLVETGYLFFNRHRMINRYLRYWQQACERSRLDGSAFVRTLQEPLPGQETGWWAALRNRIEQMPDYRPYIVRIHNLQSKLGLFRRMRSEQVSGDNPYDPAAEPVWQPGRGEYCHSGPLPDIWGLRCLALPL